jgi:hypothetical protein
MAIELMQAVTPDDEAVDLWLDVDAALAIGLAEGKASTAIYEVLAALKLEDEDEVDMDTMTTVRVTLDTESLELYLEPGALEELEASAQAELVDETETDTETEEAPTVTEEDEEADEEEGTADDAELVTYIKELIPWFPEAFKRHGRVYNLGDTTQTLASLVTIGELGADDISDPQDDPPSWDAQAALSYADSGKGLGTYPVTLMVKDEVPWVYLDADTFAKVNQTMLAEPVTAVAKPEDELSAKKRAATLLQSAMESDSTRRELFYRAGENTAIADYEVYLLEPGSVLNKIGEKLSDGSGWWISPRLRVAPTEGEDEPMEVDITAAKLLISADNKEAYIELPVGEI